MIRPLIVLLLLISGRLMAQQAEPLLFQEKVHDFGEISEESGPADTEFSFINNSGRPIKILLVQASCGCTTPGWTKEQIAPGATGVVKASFDPKGRPGFFNKSLTMTTDLDAQQIVLQIKGQVGSKHQTVSAADYPVQKGNLHFKASSFNLDKVFVNLAPATREFPMINVGSKVIHITGVVNGPAYIKADMPKELAPNEKGVIKVTYDGKMRGLYGFMSDNIEIGTDDEIQPTKSFSVYATLEEFFPVITSEEASKAPALRIEATTVDLGRVHEGTIIEREVSIRNIGKKELLIRAIQENCTCVKSSIGSKKIKPGENARVKLSFNTSARNGTQQKAVTFYTNDPKNPVQRITITSYVTN